MSIEECQSQLEDALNKKQTIILACNCSIRYSGRAESFLDYGDRIVIIKSDHSLQVHTSTGSTPVNYMKQDSVHSIEQDEKKLVLKSSNLLLKEKMTITINQIHSLNSHALEDTASIVLQGTEDDMAKMIYENPEIVETGLKAVSREEQTKYGFIDVFCVDKEGTLTIIECKRYKAELNAVTQLRRYVERLMKSKGIDKVRGIIAAPSITPNAKKMLEDWGYKFAIVKPPKYLEEYDKSQTKLGGYQPNAGS